MIRSRKPARFTELIHVSAAKAAMHPKSGDLPAALVLYFRLGDGRMFVASITPAELAEILIAIPALTLEDDEDARALFRVARMLSGEKHPAPSGQED